MPARPAHPPRTPRTARPHARERRHLQTLLRVGEAIGTIRDVPLLMRRIVEQATAAFDAERSSLFLHDPARRQLRSFVAQGLDRGTGERDGASPAEIVIDEAEGICGHVFTTRRPVCVADALRSTAFARPVAQRTGYLPRSVLAAPVFAPGTGRATCVAVLQVMHQSVGRFEPADLVLLEAVAVQVAISLENARLHAAQKAQFDSFVRALGTALERRDPITATHSLNVANYAAGVAHYLGLGSADAEWLRVAGLLHDVGKIGVPEAVLVKPGRLDPAEFEQMKAHAAYTRQILGQIQFTDELKGLDVIAAAHHEKLDGSGYPDGLRGDQIPLKARILVVADIFDALTQQRHYRTGMSVADAMGVLRSMAPHQLDARCVAALAAFVGERPAVDGRSPAGPAPTGAEVGVNP